MQFKNIKLGNDEYLIKVLLPSDFLGFELGVPINLFKIQKPKTIWDQVDEQLSQLQNDQEKNEIDLKCIKKILEIGVCTKNKQLFDANKFINNETNLCLGLSLLAEILEISLSKFKNTIELTLNDVFFYDRLASNYGKTPIEILCPRGGYTELDAFMFNKFIAFNILEEEIKQQDKILTKLKWHQKKK